MVRRASAAVAAAVALLAVQALAAPPARLEGKVLVLNGPGYTARVTLAASGQLRVTALAEGATASAPPAAVELEPSVGGVRQLAEGGFGAGGFTVKVGEDGGLQVTRGGAAVGRLAFWKDADGVLIGRLTLPAAGAWHGLGQSAKALSLPAQRFVLRHVPRFGDQTYLYLPFFFSESGVAVYLNAASDDVIAFEDGTAATLESATGRLDLYLWQGSEPQALVSRLYAMAGPRAMLPRWAHGYLQSRFGYRTADELRRTVATFLKFDLPLSAVVLDLYWFKHMGDLDWDPVAFPDPAGLIEWVHGQGVKLVTISEPFFQKESKHFAELDARGMLAKDAKGKTITWGDWWAFGGQGGGVLDPEAPGTAAVVGGYYAKLAAQGVDGFWTDLGEPESVPAGARFGPYTEAQYHDVFNLRWSKLVRDGVLLGAPGKRPFILSRSGWTGSAGLGVSTWSGDVPSSWAGLKAQVPLGLNASLSGLPYWGSDVGGFITEGGEQLPPDPELYLRWQQFGSFTPVYRAHGLGAREPWIYGPVWLKRVKAVLERRQRLVPYVYSTAYQGWSQGLPLLRPLFFLEPGEASLRSEDGAFLLGDFLLVAPVLEPLTPGLVKSVRLPRGTWVEAETLKKVEGGKVVSVPVDDVEAVPRWWKEGAIVPLDLGGEKEGLLLVPGAQPSRFVVFTDDGETEAYRQGAGEKLEVTLTATGVSFAGATSAREVTLQLPAWVEAPALEKRGAKAEGPLKVVKVALGKGATVVPFR